jgi:hypothetical protein
MIAMAPVVAIACIATERKRRRALLRRREFGGTSADPL